MTAKQRRYDQLERFFNIAAKSGIVDLSYVLKELAKAANLDPNRVIPTVRVTTT